ncbi:MAG: alkyl sulfatase dimerization domain-containing protein [Caulobacteraceae bacterium]|nr:alkyl sulfatase dimerization domain-containing protein [Caulobacteraceae bacterium]
MTSTMGRMLLAMAGLLAASAAAAQSADPPSAYTQAAQAEVLRTSPFADRQDFDFARRGFVATRTDPLIRNAAGQPVWDLSAFDFLKGEAPATVNPSLWRQGQLLAIHGLFKVSDRIWQVRGFDLANITFVKGDHGWIVIDTLGSIETAKAALDLANQSLGERPITAIIYTHPHVDHFGGAGGLVSLADVQAGQVQVIAPKGFLAAAVGENIIAGPAMQRRAAYQFGVPLPKSALGQVNSGIGPGVAVGTTSLIAPTRDIDHTGETLTIDGVRMVFQFTPGTEAPVEMNIDFPDWRIVDMAENANATQHNILTPRGAVVRDAKTWADHLTEALTLFGDSDVLITSHGWPRFGKAQIDDYLAKHRDAYAFLHDQTVRLMNQGLTGDEIAARLKLPAALEQAWYDRPYYGSLSFNSRAVYQFYMGWYDANPVHLSPLPPVEAGRRYVAAMGGAAKVRAMAQAAYDQGDYAWAAELLNRAVFADSTDTAARSLLARCYDQLGWQSENSLWRNMYLTGAGELRDGPPSGARGQAGQAAVIANLPTPMLFDLLAVRLNGDKAGAGHLKLAFIFPDRDERTYVTVENGVLIHQAIAAPGPVDATFTVNRADFLASIFTGVPLAAKVASGAAKIDGDPAALVRLMSWMDPPHPNFPIVTR